MKKYLITVLVISLLCISQISFAGQIKPGEFLVLCYHAVPFGTGTDDNYSVAQKQFVEQMEYLHAHGYHPVSLEDLIKANEGEKALPDNPVLLTFDDAYISYYKFILPLLEELGYPSVLAVVGDFIENPPKDLPEPLMSWQQIKEASSRGLVEVVSHSYGLHKSVQYNPQGNTASAISVRAYNALTKTYETEEEYRSRIEADFIIQERLFREKLGFVPRAIVWPYGRYNSISLEVAKKHGIEITFSLDEGSSDINYLGVINRSVVESMPVENFLVHEQRIDGFIRIINRQDKRPLIRAVQVDLDLVYAPDEQQMEQNLGKLIDRLYEMKVNTVFLQAFADPEDTGDIKSVYFPNRVLPVRADLFSHASHQMIIRGIRVYAWMPALSIEPTGKMLNENRDMYEDLAGHSQIQGILFQDDAKFKPDLLIEFTRLLAEGARKYRPRILFARNISCSVFEDSASDESFARNYEFYLGNYDQVIVMVCPQVYGVRCPSMGLRRLVEKVKTAKGIDKTIFKVQAYDWGKKAWVREASLLEALREILSAGGKHIAYGPDDFMRDKPALNKIKLEMSTKTYPFLP